MTVTEVDSFPVASKSNKSKQATLVGMMPVKQKKTAAAATAEPEAESPRAQEAESPEAAAASDNEMGSEAVSESCVSRTCEY